MFVPSQAVLPRYCSYSISVLFNFLCVVFSPTDNQWSVSNVMNSKDMKKKDQYSKLLFDRLSEGRRQYQMNGERVVPEESSITGGEEQIMKLKQRLEEEREEVSISNSGYTNWYRRV